MDPVVPDTDKEGIVLRRKGRSTVFTFRPPVYLSEHVFVPVPGHLYTLGKIKGDQVQLVNTVSPGTHRTQFSSRKTLMLSSDC